MISCIEELLPSLNVKMKLNPDVLISLGWENAWFKGMLFYCSIKYYNKKSYLYLYFFTNKTMNIFFLLFTCSNRKRESGMGGGVMVNVGCVFYF